MSSSAPPSRLFVRRSGRRNGRRRVYGPLLTVFALGLAAAPAAAAARMPAVSRVHRDYLVVTADEGSGSPVTYTLSCHPSGGTHPSPRAACGQLDRLGGPLGAVPRSRSCTQLFGGPRTARVVGLWRGRSVDETYRRSNGCEIQRWRLMEPVLPDTEALRGRRGTGVPAQPGHGSEPLWSPWRP